MERERESGRRDRCREGGGGTCFAKVSYCSLPDASSTILWYLAIAAGGDLWCAMRCGDLRATLQVLYLLRGSLCKVCRAAWKWRPRPWRAAPGLAPLRDCVAVEDDDVEVGVCGAAGCL
jgi:hypothetical protein